VLYEPLIILGMWQFIRSQFPLSGLFLTSNLVASQVVPRIGDGAPWF
jgi:hypothetical protein